MQTRNLLTILLTGGVALGFSGVVDAQQTQGPTTSARTAPSDRRAGLDLFGGVGITWAAAIESFEAIGLERTATEFGGGTRATNIWRDLFVQATVSRWSDNGERVFVDSSGERFPLGIPLDLKATYVDISTGWKSPLVTETGRTYMWTYVGAGAGMAMYSEESPFAEEGDDFDTRTASYHIFAGAEVPLVSGLAAAFDAKYRFVPNVFGEGGVSGELNEDLLGGFQMSAGVRLGFGGGARHQRAVPSPPPAGRTVPESKPPTSTPDVPLVLPPQKRGLETGVIIEAAPVFLLPDAERTPLKTLTVDTPVRILEEAGDWLRIEFTDNFGARVGYVQRKFVRWP